MKPEKEGASSHQEAPCPPWLCFTFDNPFRRLVQNPYKILKPLIKTGWTVLDVGPGMGYFTIPMAKLAGDTGKIIAADLQPQMLEGVKRRAVKAGVENRIVLHRAEPDNIGVNEPVDFCLAFWMVHEVPGREGFLKEIASILKPGGLFLIVEPVWHVHEESFNATVGMAEKYGLTLIARPKVFISRGALLKK